MAKTKIRKIETSDIRSYHPKGLGPCPTDKDYASVANDLHAILEKQQNLLPESVDIRDMAIRLALYFEDVISEGLTWRSFIYLCRKLYGRTLPFFPEENMPNDMQEYYEGEVNFDDVRLLMWFIIQQVEKEEKLINPENPGLALVAAEIFAYLMENFEKQPINFLLNAPFLTIPEKPYDQFLHMRSIMEWILTRNYLFTGVDVDEDLDDVRETIEAYFNNSKTDKAIIDYYVQVEAPFTLVCGPLSLYPKQWLAAMLKIFSDSTKKLAAKVIAIEYKKIDIYAIEDINGEYIHLKDCYDQSYKVLRYSFKSVKGINACKSTITSLAQYEPSCYFINGSVAMLPQEIPMQQLREIKDEQRYGHSLNSENVELVSKEKYIKTFGGKRHKFFASQRELVKAMTPKEQQDSQNEQFQQLLNKTDDTKPIFVYVCDDGQIMASEYLAELIPARDNPFRLKTPEAAAEFFCAVMGGEMDPEVIQYIINKGWAKSLSMNSVKGEKYGKKLLQENICFLNRFLHPCEWFALHTDI